jgi:hypothetical protein
MKCLSMLIIIMLLCVNSAYALDTKDAYDELRFIDLQLRAVTIDMYLPLGWYPDDKEMIRRVSFQAIKDLEELKGYLGGLDFPEDLKPVREKYSQAISILQNAYQNIELKNKEEVQPLFQEVERVRSDAGAEGLKVLYRKHKDDPELPDDYNVTQAELAVIDNEQDRDLYKQASELMDGKKYKDAYSILQGLQKQYIDTMFEDVILLRMSDCVNMADSDIKDIEEKMLGLELLTTILDKQRYSPILYKAYYKWRTLYQAGIHGMSNYSEIPNKEYNNRRYDVMQVIKEYIRDNPDDLWADAQVSYLLSLHNITRGGEMGNNNIIDWGILFTDIGKDKSDT